MFVSHERVCDCRSYAISAIRRQYNFSESGLPLDEECASTATTGRPSTALSFLADEEDEVAAALVCARSQYRM